jgi:hypothetical protein
VLYWLSSNDPLAQLGERLGDNQKVDSSSLLRVTKMTALELFRQNQCCFIAVIKRFFAAGVSTGAKSSHGM